MYPWISIFGRAYPTYGICLTTGLFSAFFMAFFRVKKRGLSVETLTLIGATAFAFALIGAKLLYLIVSVGIGNFINQIRNGDFSALGSGGLVFYGGLIAGVFGGFLGGKLGGENAIDYVESIVPAIPFGHAFGRLGCFFAGCCYGKEWHGPLAVTFPKVGITTPVLPTQLLEAIANCVLSIILIICSKRVSGKLGLLRLYLFGYGVIRFCLEYLRDDAIRGAALGLSTSQWISILMIITAIIIWVKEKRV